ncbi:MAG: DUF72 domain-containing protein [Armatimonadota bacterium]|nr:DUF72 domain-containing protein [Armatimonadota bacterium]MDR7547029.1 DUF72 domain-containing protein [Armatimonadota bacterium]MDR7558051.1 DUF72 domain-containing protein [Armatimonadota bacterium]
MVPSVPLDLDRPARPVTVGRCAVYVGTCSWADPNFVREGGFYPRSVRNDPERRLRYYATVFPTVEVDATYHALQSPDRAAKWVRWTPSGFIFAVKAFALFTWHATDPRRLPPEILALLPPALAAATEVEAAHLPEEILHALWDYFAAFLEEFVREGRLAHVLFQFPKGRRYTPDLFRHLDRWEPYLRRWPVAVEIRHREWLEEPHRSELLSYLRRRGYAYVIPDLLAQAYLPPSDVEVTAPWSVVRFHGRNPAMLECRAPTSRVYDYLYTAEELRPWVHTVQSLGSEVERIFLLFNNHYRGQSARNAREILAMLTESPARPP